MAQYLYGLIFAAMDSETENYKRSEHYQDGGNYRKSLTVSFQKGMAGRIHKRLQEMKVVRKSNESREDVCLQTTGTSLIAVKIDKVKNEFEQLHLNIRRAACTRPRVRYDSYQRGQEAGGRINLNRPMPSNVVGYLK
jgi:hypothetical protein